MMTTDNLAVIIGNGPSRKKLDLTLFDDYITYGCNALYRDYAADYLIAIDPVIIYEIRQSTLPMKTRFIVPPLEEQYEPEEYAGKMRPRSNAGMNAMNEAIKNGHSSLLCLGFDFFNANIAFSCGNIYEGSNGYGPETHTVQGDNYNRLKYLLWFVKKNHDITFTFAIDEGIFLPETETLTKLPNVIFTTIKMLDIALKFRKDKS